ncbi:MAG: transposase [Blastocatellia bacterium]
MSNFEWDDNDRPLAYFITFRTHGTWLHCDGRKSVDRHGKNIFGTERIGLDPKFSVLMDRNMSTEPVVLNGPQRSVVEEAIRNVCLHREYTLHAFHVRTNHAHSVVWAARKPDVVMNAFKANATRELREAGLIAHDFRIWARGGSTRYLWKPESVQRAVNYTLYGQGEELPEF